MTGYEIRQLVEDSIGHFWHESYGQIYPALREIHRAGLVSRKKRRSAGKPERHEYTISPSGRSHLLEWLSREPRPERVRHELLLKLHFAVSGNLQDHLRNIEKYRDRQQDLLHKFEWIRSEYFKPLQGDPGLPFWEAELSYGLHVAKARVTWAKETISKLRNIKGTE
jgi:DNA-binding PadR family transcriptional regulator